jgi:3-isopropylmalate/(R)-2-methylmalate dehydratase large subunit
VYGIFRNSIALEMTFRHGLRQEIVMPVAPSTLYQKLWDSHLVKALGDGQDLIYIDRQMLHEVSSPQAFVQLDDKNLPVRRPETQLAVVDHAIPTLRQPGSKISGPAQSQMELHAKNCAAHDIRFFDADDERQGIVHVVGPEQGFTLPGISLVCGDSHTATHGAFGALAFGIGTSEVACVLANQVLIQQRMKTMSVEFRGKMKPGTGAKDMILALIGAIGASGAKGYAIEYCGDAVRSLSMEARMTLCNMTIEAGSRIGLIAPDAVTFAYIKGRKDAPPPEYWEQAIAHWQTLASDTEAQFHETVVIDVERLSPMVTWGTSPDQVMAVSDVIPEPRSQWDSKALAYMRLSPAPMAG